jgi:SGNH domain (fused to AT3 domains)/Acyltransferase family
LVQTPSNATVAFFSPFTRAWELALGALIAVGSDVLRNTPVRIATIVTWVGLGMILCAAGALTSSSTYPGWLVALPVGGTALLIAGGVAAPFDGAERLLGLAVFQRMGTLSYSFYLWHWPILIIAAEYRNSSQLPFVDNLGLLAIALAASFVTYSLVENPVRHARFNSVNRWNSPLMGVLLVAVTLVATTVMLDTTGQASSGSLTVKGIVPGTDAQISRAVAASVHNHTIPKDVVPSVQASARDFGAPNGRCTPAVGQISVPACVFGDRHGARTMVLYGDSHALMWFQAVNAIAKEAHWRLVLLGKGYCMANTYPLGTTGLMNLCARWQAFAVRRIRALDPDLVVVTQEYQNGPGQQPYTAEQWKQAMEETFDEIRGRHTKLVVIGNIPKAVPSPPDCLAEHPTDVQACSVRRHDAYSAYDQYDQAEQSLP